MLTKVVTSYVQFMSLAREIDYPWPNVVVAGTTGTQVSCVAEYYNCLCAIPLTSLSFAQLMSVDCAIADLGVLRERGGPGVFYARAVLYTILPVCFVFGAAVFWGINWVYRRYFRKYAVTTDTLAYTHALALTRMVAVHSSTQA